MSDSKTRPSNQRNGLANSSPWTIEDSRELYGFSRWSEGYFGVNHAGHIAVRPGELGDREIDLLSLVDELRGRGIRMPMLLRFSDILANRVKRLNQAFARAIQAFGYTGSYRGVYPIKVNQQRHVVEEILASGAEYNIGLEAGSKAELLIALATLDTPDALIICNGYKDRAYIEIALLAQQLGRTPVIVIERYQEIELVVKASKELGIRPHLGIRGRLSARGAGKWMESTGNRSKFGLSPSEIVAAADHLHSEGMLDCLELLHFHIGSQITAIRAHKDALREVSRLYVGLRGLGADNLSTIDVGGGLGVDYEGNKSDSHSSINYSTQEYANDVVAAIQEACDELGLSHPDIVSESGRALVAHHAVLVFDVLGVSEIDSSLSPLEIRQEDPALLRAFEEVIHTLEDGNVQEAYHDALQIREEADHLFRMGYLDLRGRARAENHFQACCTRIVANLQDLDPLPNDLRELSKDLSDTYYANFSVFQSAPDHWAVDQLFPIAPIHRLDERPTRRGVFADLTCDSDGKIDRFISPRGEKRALELHALDGAPYYIGIFLVGAYQEILGDLHNLFGDTDAVHVKFDDKGGYQIEHVVEGDSISDVLRYVQYDPAVLIEKVRLTIERALKSGRISLQDSARLRKNFGDALRSHTYLTQESSAHLPK